MIAAPERRSCSCPAFRGAGSGWRRPSTRWRSAAASSRSRSATSRPAASASSRARGIENYLQQIDEALDRAGAGRRDPDRRLVQRTDRSGIRGPPPGSRARARARVGAAARLDAEPARALLPARAALAEPAVPARFAGARAARNPGRASAVRPCACGSCAGQLHAHAERVSVAVAHGGAAALERSVSIRRSIAVSQPVLVITGEDGLDRVVVAGADATLSAALPTRAMPCCARTGHIGLLTRPRSLPMLVRRFADEVSSDADVELLREIPRPGRAARGACSKCRRASRAPPRCSRIRTRCYGGTMHTQGGVSGDQGAGADWRRGAALQLSRRRPQRGDARRRPWRDGRLPRGARLRGGRYPGMPLWAAGFSFGSLGRVERRASTIRACRLLLGIGAAGGSLRLRAGEDEREGEVPDSRRARRAHLDPRHPEVLRGAAGAERAGRDRGRRSSVRWARPRKCGESRRRTCSQTGTKGNVMKDAVIVSAVRTAVGKAPKGTLSVMRPDDMASVVIREALARAPGVSPARRRRRDSRLRDAGGRAGPERRAHRQPARRRADRGVGGDGQPLLLVRPAGDRVRRRAHHARPARRSPLPAAPSR